MVIVSDNVTRCFSTGHGVTDVTLSVEAGQCLGVLGANGSGKTTLTRLVAGLEKPDGGRLTVLGAASHRRSTTLRSRWGVALDTCAHWEKLSGRQNLLFFAHQYGLAGAKLAERTEELLVQADLLTQADDPVATYSFGMRRKLGIIEALVHDPDLLILDEPSAGIDVAFADRLAHWIRQRSEWGRTTWVADNDPDWLGRTVTHAIWLVDGKVRAQGAVSTLMASIGARNRIEIILEESGPKNTPDIPGIYGYRCEGNRLEVDLDGQPELPAQLLKWIASHQGHVRSMEIHAVTLREALARQAGTIEVKS